MKMLKVLYFVDGPAPKSEDIQAAEAMNAKVVFRNARAVPSEAHCLETCDGVAGKVPAIYAKQFPAADEAIAKRKKELDALNEKLGDEKAPKPKQKQPSKPAENKSDPKPPSNPAGWQNNA